MPTTTTITRKVGHYTKPDLMALLNISDPTFENWLKMGKVPQPIRPGGPRGKRLWSVECIDAWLASLNNNTVS